MHFREGVLLALRQIRQEKLKSGFSVLGVIIGVMFLVVVVSVVEGMDRYITEDFAQELFGINTVQVRRFPSVQVNTSDAQRRAWARIPRPTLGEADAIRRGLSVPGLVGVESSFTTSVRTRDGRRANQVQVAAISEEVLSIRNLSVELGRPFSAQEAARGVPVAILGISVADALFPNGDALEGTVRIREFPYRVVGVLEPQGSLLGISLDNRVLIPARSRAGRVYPERDAVGGMIVQAADPAELETVRMDTEAALRAVRGLRPSEDNNFSLETAGSSLAFWDRISTILFIALPGLVGISLVVGGIVIMNIMLVSVMERTREIGVRKALGARQRDIVVQFLVESATLSCAGAVIGVGIGVALATAVNALTPLPASLAPGWMAAGVLLGVGVGIAAGVYPALRASRMDPVVALRYE